VDVIDLCREDCQWNWCYFHFSLWQAVVGTGNHWHLEKGSSDNLGPFEKIGVWSSGGMKDLNEHYRAFRTACIGTMPFRTENQSREFPAGSAHRLTDSKYR